jgi:16S rRNA (guanine(966)-N(2))-methyltransferase RsmD
LIRISGGRLRGRYIKTPPDKITRPALSSVRLAVFNILAPVLPDSSFLDLFGGSGAYAIEAMSRGARQATIVEINHRAASVIRENLKSTGLDQSVRLIVGDALKAIPAFAQSGVEFDIIAVAPPHFAGLVEKTVAVLDDTPGLVRNGGVVFVQHHHGEKLPAELRNLLIGRVYRYGITQVSLLHRASF